MTMTGVVLGTPGYLAPERRSGHPATVQSDLYAVGAVMVETLTGQRLGPGGVRRRRACTPHLARRGRHAPWPTIRGHRFASANDMLQALQTATTGTRQGTRPGPAAHPATMTVQVPVQPSSPARRHRAPHRAAAPAPRDRRTPTRRRRRLALAAIAVVDPRRRALPAARDWRCGRPGRPPRRRRTTASVPRATRSRARIRHRPPTPRARPSRRCATSHRQRRVPGRRSPGQRPAGDGGTSPPGRTGRPRRSRHSPSPASCSTVAGITSGQYQDVVNVLQPTGATVTTTTMTTPTAPARTPLPGAASKVTATATARGAVREVKGSTACREPIGRSSRWHGDYGLRSLAEVEEGPMQMRAGRRGSRP